MYCPDCNRLTDEARCPVCRNRELREPEAGDPCFLAELDYIHTGIFEDLLKQEGIPFMKKGVLGAGMAIKVGPMLERGMFFVPYARLEAAQELLDELMEPADGELFPDEAPEAEPAEDSE